MSVRGALAIFVKTPGLSPIKTRLAATTGGNNARRFYDLSLLATEALAKAVACEVPSLQIYWAVAEREGVHAMRWQSFPTLFQGTGDLGARLSFVYQDLLTKHQYVCLMGADSPHLKIQDLKNGVLLTQKHLHDQFVLGRVADGGFYFFGGSIPLSSSIWRAVEYSTEQTAFQLITQISKIGGFDFIEESFDVDIESDLRRYIALNVVREEFLREQQDLFKWATDLLITGRY